MTDAEARMDRLRRAARQRYAQQEGQPERGTLDPDEVRAERRRMTAADLPAYAREAIAQAERDGFFADNPYHGKPLPGIDGQHDPDWWVKRLVEREQLTGLAPPALALRKEDADLDDRLDALDTADQVRDVVRDFDARIVEARRQLLGGPPVITRLRDIETEVARWQERRDARLALLAAERAEAEALAAEAEAERRQRRRWWRRR